MASDLHDHPSISDVLDAALTHLVESEENINDASGELDPETIQQSNAIVLGLKFHLIAAKAPPTTVVCLQQGLFG